MLKVMLAYSVLLLWVTTAGAEIVKVTASTGRLINHTSLPSESFQVQYNVSCMSARRESCGQYQYVAQLKNDGTYLIPEFELDALSNPKTERNYSVYVFISIPEKSSARPADAAPAGYSTAVENRKAQVADLKAPNFTLLESRAGLLDVTLPGNRDLADFLSKEGRDEGVTIEMDFTLGHGSSRDVQQLEQTGFTLKNWVNVKRRFYMLAGEYGANAPFDYKVTEKYKEIKSGRANFNPDITRVFGRLEISGASKANVPERRLTGTFADSYFQLDYPLQDKFQFAEIGFSYATMKAECISGQITGELIFREGQFPDDPETMRVPLSGTCAADSGEIVFSLKRKNGKEEKISTKYARIQANDYEKSNGAKSISRTLLSTDGNERLFEYKGEELTMFMASYLSDGSFAGQLQVSTEN